MSRDRGELESAVKYAKALVTLAPTDPEARQLLESLQRNSADTTGLSVQPNQDRLKHTISRSAAASCFPAG